MGSMRRKYRAETFNMILMVGGVFAALFYLRSRGIDEAASRRMLIEAFATDAIEASVPASELRMQLRRRLGVWLEQSGSS